MGRFEYIEPVGEGGMGKVFLVKDGFNEWKKLCLKISKYEYNSRIATRISTEASVWFKFRSIPQVVQVYEIVRVKGQLGILMEYLERGNIRGLLLEKKFGLEDRLMLLFDIVKGIKECIEVIPGFCHLDLKPENILLSKYGLGKISDFGLSTLNDSGNSFSDNRSDDLFNSVIFEIEEGRFSGGTPQYMAPEQLSGNCSNGQKADVFSIGLLAIEILNGTGPIEYKNIKNLFSARIGGQDQNYRMGHHVPNKIRSAVLECLDLIPENRPDISKLESIVRAHLKGVNSTKSRGGDRLPDYAIDEFRKSFSFWTLGKKTEAIELLEHAINIDPFSSHAWFKLAEWKMEINDQISDKDKIEIIRYIFRGLWLTPQLLENMKSYWDDILIALAPSTYDVKSTSSVESYNELLDEIKYQEKVAVNRFKLSAVILDSNLRSLCVKCGEIKYPIISRCPSCGFLPIELTDIFHSFLLRLGNLESNGPAFADQRLEQMRSLRKMGENIQETIEMMVKESKYQIELEKFSKTKAYHMYKAMAINEFVLPITDEKYFEDFN